MWRSFAYAPGGEPAESWPVQIWSDDHTHALRVSRPSERRTVEAHLPHTLLDTLAFEAPASFQALEAPGGTETHRALDLFHRDPPGAFNGLVRVDLDIGVLAGRSTIAPSGGSTRPSRSREHRPPRARLTAAQAP